MTTGALVLAIAGVLATKTNKNFAIITTGYVHTGGSIKSFVYLPNNMFTSLGNAPTIYAYFYTSGGGSLGIGAQLYTTSAGTTPVRLLVGFL